MDTKNAAVLVMNAGSSSLKFALFVGAQEECLGRGSITGIGTKAVFAAKGPGFDGKKLPDVSNENCKSPSEGARILLDWLDEIMPDIKLVGVGHRVVHGGDMAKPTIVRPYILAYLKTLIPLAPLHQPFNLDIIEFLQKIRPSVLQVACFDTSYHTTVPSIHTRFAIPRIWHDKGVRRYGFHGLSYEYISRRLKEVAPKAYEGKTLVAHMGNGASMCAMDGGKSFATTMGFSVLDGLIMGTRPGVLDAGVVLYFLREAKLDEPAIERMLYHDSGLRGVSGVSNDMSVLLKSDSPNAREAIDLFCLRATREGGGLISLLGGIDALVFTGGIGENAAPIRSQILESLSWLGIRYDQKLNANLPQGEVRISTPQSSIEVWVVPTNEEVVISGHTREVLTSRH
ncbi:MAG: acetate/propionate family kinase [Proteobacteria bacterium]|jgi:acetate kinase|nr:acetate/propionate family kinase [Alphaproteobacteria bacterium]NCC04025.1 acetate/propionate family kinase [Pseudomonadota bacterium]